MAQITVWGNGKYMSVLDVQKLLAASSGEMARQCKRALAGESDAWWLVKAHIQSTGLALPIR